MSALEPAPGKGPIFVMGSMGTGTTLLRLVLDSHDSIAIPPETGFMRAYKAHKFIPFKWTGRNWAKRLGWSDEELDVELGAFYDRLFKRYVETHGKQRWGEKTPLHIWHWDAMARVFPDAVFVAIIRHPGGSMASNMTRWRFSEERAATHFERYTREMFRQSAKYPDRTVLLRYEELLLQPEPVLRELLGWLGEPWSDKVLEHHKVQAERGGREMVEGRNRVSDPLDVSRISKWTSTLDSGAQRRLDKRIGRLSELMGYSMTDPAVLDAVNDREAFITGGAEIAARIERYPELRLERRGNVPRFERYYHPREFTLMAVQTLPSERKSEEDEGVRLSPSRRLLMRIPRPVRARLGRARQRVLR
jgi:hypothetical protein